VTSSASHASNSVAVLSVPDSKLAREVTEWSGIESALLFNTRARLLLGRAHRQASRPPLRSDCFRRRDVPHMGLTPKHSSAHELSRSTSANAAVTSSQPWHSRRRDRDGLDRHRSAHPRPASTAHASCHRARHCRGRDGRARHRFSRVHRGRARSRGPRAPAPQPLKEEIIRPSTTASTTSPRRPSALSTPTCSPTRTPPSGPRILLPRDPLLCLARLDTRATPTPIRPREFLMSTTKRFTNEKRCTGRRQHQHHDRRPAWSALLQDIWLLEKLAHFDREVIPERRMHAKGWAAHGTFSRTHDITRLRRRRSQRDRQETPMFARFSTLRRARRRRRRARYPRHCAEVLTPKKATGTSSATTRPVFSPRPLRFPDLNHAIKRDPRTGPASATIIGTSGRCCPGAAPVTVVMSTVASRKACAHALVRQSHLSMINAANEPRLGQIPFRTQPGIQNLPTPRRGPRGKRPRKPRPDCVTIDTRRLPVAGDAVSGDEARRVDTPVRCQVWPWLSRSFARGPRPRRSVRFWMPCCVRKWNLTQTRSFAALIIEKV